jgi:hypothetical protein
MTLSAKEAAEQVGMTKQGIIKAIRQGKISAEKDLNGEWRIEPVELFRVYTPVHSNGHQPAETSFQENTAEDTGSLQVELRLLRERLADKDDVIEDLRRRLDAEAEERRKLTLMLTELRNAPAPAVEKPKGFWQRLFG